MAFTGPITSYHNHTDWSDGTSSLAEMIQSARSAGLDELGISDHYALHPDGRQRNWALKSEFLPEYISLLREAAQNSDRPLIRYGLEVDYFPETIDIVRQRLAPYLFDYLICSVHFANGFPVDLNAKLWSELSEDARNGVWRSYWMNLRAAILTKQFDFVAHFDLPKKFGLFPTVDQTSEALSVLDTMADADVAIEINTSGWDKPVREAYPSLFYLKEARRRGIPLVINADAHRAGDVVNHFGQARELALEAGYTTLASFRERRRFFHPLI